MTMCNLPVDGTLSPQLTDLITEAVVWTGRSDERAQALLQIVNCVMDAICWRLEPDGQPEEELSAQAVVSAAAEHLRRMRPAG